MPGAETIPMTDQQSDQQPLSGSLLLYERPELLTREEHGHLGLRSLPRPFAFARDVHAVPLLVTEFRSAQRFGPVVFTDRVNPVPLAVLGLENRNLMIDEDGQWQVPGYVPAYLRRYPFALANATSDRYAMVIDRAADMVSEQHESPFFEGEELSAAVQERLEFCRNYQAETQRTEAFCANLERLDLLVQQQANHTADGQERAIASYYAVDQERLMALDDATVVELFRNGAMAAILAHLFSLDNFMELVHLRHRRGFG